MPITPRTRKILWVKAGGRCSICGEQLATDAESGDDPSVIGEECHIVARSPGGARAAEIADIDGYGNLILLCRKHHKQVDDQRSHFTVERLKQIKREHEAREASRDDHGPIRLVPDPARPAPEVLTLCLTGEALWQAVSGSYSFRSSYPAGLTDDQADAVDSLLDELGDWLHVANEMSHKQQRQAARGLGEHITQLADLGLVVGTCVRHMLLTGGISAAPSPWPCFDIEVQRIKEAQLANADGTPLVNPEPPQAAHANHTGQSR
jgi:hypothetical protein